jgi:AcrR family transcriptional regulator
MNTHPLKKGQREQTTMPKVVTPDERERKRRAILDAAAAEIAQHGHDRANINTIAERAGIGRGTIYLYFASKEEVLEALLDAIGGMIDDTVRACMVADLPWRVRLHSLAQAFADLAREHHDFFRVHVSALHGVNRDVGAPMARWLRTSVQQLAAALSAAARRGEIADLPPETVAGYILSALESLVLLPDVLGEGAAPATEQVDVLTALLWRGLAPHERV